MDYLAACTEDEIALTFVAMEAVIGKPLANSAYTSSEYWLSPRLLHVQRWRALGWVASIDRRNDCVIFTRGTEQGW